jgi:hypothetical protein
MINRLIEKAIVVVPLLGEPVPQGGGGRGGLREIEKSKS